MGQPEPNYYKRRGYLGRLTDVSFLNHAWKPGYYVTARLHINGWKPSYPFLDVDLEHADTDALVMRWFLEVWDLGRNNVSVTSDVSLLYLLDKEQPKAAQLATLINRWSSHNVRRGNRRQLAELRAARMEGKLKYANSYHEDCGHLRSVGLYHDGKYWSPGLNSEQPFHYGCVTLYEPLPTYVLKESMGLMGELPAFNAYS